MEQGLLILQLSFDLPRMTRHIPTSASLQQNHESTVLAKPSLSKPSTVSVFSFQHPLCRLALSCLPSFLCCIGCSFSHCPWTKSR